MNLERPFDLGRQQSGQKWAHRSTIQNTREALYKKPPRGYTKSQPLPGECRAQAWQEINGEWERRAWPLYIDYEDLEARIAALPEVVAIEDRWAECMRGRGHQTVQSVVSLLAPLNDKVNRFVESLAMTLDGDAEVRLDEYHQQWFDDLEQEERAAASDSVACLESDIERYLALREPHEAEFLEAHPDLPILPGADL